MNYTKNTSTAISRMLLPLFAAATIFLSVSCQDDKKETTSKTEIEMKDNTIEQTSVTADEILAQEKAWAAALVADDLDTVASIMHRDFRLKRVYGDAPPISKEMYLGMEGMSASSAEVTSVTITEEAGPIVVARVTWSMDWEQEGVGKLPPHSDLIDIWKKSDTGIWQILSRISQIVEEPYTENKNRD